jgi:hypothetical protein
VSWSSQLANSLMAERADWQVPAMAVSQPVLSRALESIRSASFESKLLVGGGLAQLAIADNIIE